MGADGTQRLEAVHRYLRDEWSSTRAAAFPTFELIPNRPSTPRQGNTYDCGVYVCFFAMRQIANLPLVVSPAEITRFRGWIAHTILTGHFPDVLA